MLPKDFQVLPEDVQNWQPLHRVLTAFAEAIKELQERVGVPANDENPKPEKAKSHGATNAGRPTTPASTD